MWNQSLVSANDDIKAIVKVPSPQLHELGVIQEGKDRDGKVLFHSQIISTVKFLGGDWDKDMANQAAILAYQEANWMTVPEVKLFFTRVWCGKYSSNKNFTPGIFMEYLNNYINEVLSVRGAVNAYEWRLNTSTELTPLPDGTPGREIDPNIKKAAIEAVTKIFVEAVERAKAEEKKEREERWQRLKIARALQVIESVERECERGNAPDKLTMKLYFDSLEIAKKKDL